MQDMGILEMLKKNNEFPILFIGSGISKRYLEGYPKWIDLLEEVWSEYNQSDVKFYNMLNKTKNNLKKEILDSKNLDFCINIETAQKLEEIINEAFNNEKIDIPGLTAKEVYDNNCSPFKYLLAERFSKYNIKRDKTKEIESFSRMILKSQVIFTTNYDSFIEDQYNLKSNYSIDKYIGQKGLFQSTPDYAEIYKLHGCMSQPNSIVITKEDYQKFDENSVLISAKIISMLLYSPIVFLGYSLTDRNVRKIIKDFSKSLSSNEKKKLKKRIVIVEYKEGEKKLLEDTEYDRELDCPYTVIKTDNYKEIYDEISKINQGLAPTEIRRYQHVIKKLIVDRGKEGTLDTLLVSPNELDAIEDTIKNKNIAIALGDRATLFIAPTIVDYCISYINEDFNQNIDVILRFLANRSQSERVPMLRYINAENLEKSTISKREKEKNKNYLDKHNRLEKEMNDIPYKKKYEDFEAILKENQSNDSKIYQYIAYNIDNLNLEKIKRYILEKLNEIKQQGEIKVGTQLRRLCLIYDLYKNGEE